MNKVILCGNLGSDPEIRQTANSSVCNFSLATTEREKMQGNWEDVTSWHRITCWGKTAENCGRFLGKGSKVLIEGKLKYGSYEKDGRTVYTTEIVAFSVTFLTPKGQSRDQGSGHKSHSTGEDVPF